MADKTIEADKTDRLLEIDKGLKEKRVDPDVLASVKELLWQLKMRKVIPLTNLKYNRSAKEHKRKSVAITQIGNRVQDLAGL